MLHFERKRWTSLSPNNLLGQRENINNRETYHRLRNWNIWTSVTHAIHDTQNDQLVVRCRQEHDCKER